MNESIKTICQALKEEAEAIISYTDKLESVNDKIVSTAQILEKIRMDEVEHIQSLCLELTKLVTEGVHEGELDE